ncbi:DNA glycosylase AlkZ-like family protein [Phytomonospora endophytica]|uniref:Winged helix DNA-binding domain-containing protein n=1 Tax=Phytomonospora endophytica TaxID=714109 RepID=A0A841FKE2_9ACTN|nr:crosslink repair DNA glycosylase YcaQ family protein [Phytomonospora endophytica]MBB6034298.1 hypothetical protein [Phytomonospora endophytica]GIG66692.1 hypothetical protein Pen01_29870 [Phytomonospora endophytica]
MKISLGRALSWRMGRHFLLGGATSAEEAVGRLGAVGAHSGDPELAVRRRLADSTPGEVERALDAGRLMKTFAFRGATHLMAPQDAGRYLALRAAGRQWELPSWVDHYKVEPRQWPALREIVRGLVADGPITVGELADGVAGHAAFAHLGPEFTAPSQTFLKPFAWQGDLCFGPVRNGHATFQSPNASPHWSGVPELDEAGRYAVAAYFDAYGPATREHVHYWLGGGLSAGRKRIDRWLDELKAELADITVDGESMLFPVRHLDALSGQAATTAVTLLPGHDQWVLGSGTADERIVPAGRRAVVTRGAGLVLSAGVVSGTWKGRAGTLTVSWFAEAGEPPGTAIEAEADRLAGLLGGRLDLGVDVV